MRNDDRRPAWGWCRTCEARRRLYYTERMWRCTVCDGYPYPDFLGPVVPPKTDH
jgi:hypothetical protein